MRRGRGGKEKEWTDCVQSDIRAFGTTGDWKTMVFKAEVWVEAVTEGGRRFMAASSSSSLHAAMNLRPPSVIASTQTSAFNAIVFQSPAMPNARMSLCTQSVHSFSFPPRSLRTAPSRFQHACLVSSLIIPDVCMVFDYGKQVYTTVVPLLLCCRRALLLLSAPVILMMEQLPSNTPETMQQRTFAVCCTHCTCPCLHAWVEIHRL